MMDKDNMEVLRKKIDDLNAEAWKSRLEDSDKAFALSLEALDLSRQIDYRKGRAPAILIIGYCHMRRSENEDALQALHESLSLFETLNDQKGQTEAYEYLSVVWRNLGEIERSLRLTYKALDLAREIGYTEKEASINYQLGVTYKRLANFEKALDHLYESLELSRNIQNDLYKSYPIHVIGAIFLENNDYGKAIEYFKRGLEIRHRFGDKWGEAGSLDNIGYCYLKLHRFDDAIVYINKSLEINRNISDNRGHANALTHLAELYDAKHEISKAKEYAHKSLELRKAFGDKRAVAEALLLLAAIEMKSKSPDRDLLLRYLSQALQSAGAANATDMLSKARKQLYEYNKSTGNFQEALSQLEIHHELETVLNKQAVSQKITSLEITSRAEEAKREASAARLKNEELSRLNREISEQKKVLEATLASLKATQSQLIHSEKMAGLGELTAGIAHEIQNPLNFVNNFSEISKELLEEMKEEWASGEEEAALVIANDLKQNLEKILHHGKRADSIVKNMLEHSRVGTGVKEPTDINKLADEYLRLAYHGLRAKDKSPSAGQAGFNAEIPIVIGTDFDNSIGKINVVPQDIGRVVLNLINNAFYAVNERQKLEGRREKGEENTSNLTASTSSPIYKPLVTLQTKRINDNSGSHQVEIRVNDNGSGIPDAIKEKIFQPFFTTKPTGQGTGLGLSLSYDIVKAHGGEIRVETQQIRPDNLLLQAGGDAGTKFIIRLPAQ